ncbi:MAG: hypothetical protein JJU06_07915 [Ectothiorhodospiraceae bacterium]|nr:hypothetical protein [Ectothiorhodospiraceae bacterium]
MALTVTAAYGNLDKAINAFDELVSDGFAREELFLDRESNQVKVIAPETVKREVEEILLRHEPDRIWDRPYHIE